MSQSTLIAMAVFGAWIIYVTMRGSLPTYMALLFGSTSATASPAGTSTSSTPGIPSLAPLTSLVPQASDNTALTNVFSNPVNVVSSFNLG